MFNFGDSEPEDHLEGNVVRDPRSLNCSFFFPRKYMHPHTRAGTTQLSLDFILMIYMGGRGR